MESVLQDVTILESGERVSRPISRRHFLRKTGVTSAVSASGGLITLWIDCTRDKIRATRRLYALIWKTFRKRFAKRDTQTVVASRATFREQVEKFWPLLMAFKNQ